MTNRAGGLTPEQFVEKWSKARLSERQSSHSHFNDLCEILGQPTPTQADATGADYCFEKHVKVVGSASKGSKGDFGFVDVWKRGFFAWEYKAKGKHKTLDEAYRQLYQYRDDLDNPPLSVVCDIRTTEIRAHFPGYPTTLTVVRLEEIPGRLEVLRRVFTNPQSFKPEKTRVEMTGHLADIFGELADKLIERVGPVPATLWHGHGDPVAHFLMKVMFCLFAEDVGLLPANLFTELVDRCNLNPAEFKPACAELFEKMKRGGHFGNARIPHFNGGLFDDEPPLAMTHVEMPVLLRAAGQQWGAVEPSIFGTLFERILDPKKRAQIGAHYTSKADILLVVDPVIMTPLRRKWAQVQEQVAPQLEQVKAERDAKKRDVLSAPVRVALTRFREFLGQQQILDPACGSGNFLYVALQRLLDLDDEVVRFAARYDIALNPLPEVYPTQLHGIEINPYAAELAQNVIWIGYLQWLAEHHVDNPKRPILEKLSQIENRDAILDLSKPNLPVPAQWPPADFIIGNPPFLGVRLFRRSGLSNEYVASLFSAYEIPKTVDLCVYWFERARALVELYPRTRVGLLATQGIRGRDSRAVLDRITEQQTIFLAWSDHEWTLEGAAVHVSIIGFSKEGTDVDEAIHLDGLPVSRISSRLNAGTNTAVARKLAEMRQLSFQGPVKVGDFDIPWTEAGRILSEPAGPTGRRNTDVVRQWRNGDSITSRYDGRWIIDFAMMSEQEACVFEAPFEYVRKHVKPSRDRIAREGRRLRWWLFGEPNPAMRGALSGLPRFVATCQTAKYRLWVWLRADELAGQTVIGVARSDDYALGVLHSAPHELWSLKSGTQLEDRPRYTPTTCFETFPLPWPPGKEDVAHPAYLRISESAKALNEQRERWLNPPEWIEPLAAKIDAADTFEDVPKEARALIRQSAIMAAAAKDSRLKKRTLTNLYNERPTWLKLAHEALDRAVLAAYAAVDPNGGWSEDWAAVWVDTGAGQPPPVEHPLRARRAEIDQRVLANLLRLNHERAGKPTPRDSSSAKAAAAPRAHRLLDDPKLAKALAEYRDGLRELYDPGRKDAPEPGERDDPKPRPRLDRVVLFGSRARSKASRGSDADVLIVLNGKFDPDEELERTSKLTADVSLRHGVMINRIVMNKKQADSKNGPLQDNIARDGVVL